MTLRQLEVGDTRVGNRCRHDLQLIIP